MHSPAGSSGAGSPGVETAAQREAEQPAEVAEVAVLAAVHVLPDPAGDHDAGQVAERGQRGGDVQVEHGRVVLGTGTQRRDDGVGHDVGDRGQVLG